MLLLLFIYIVLLFREVILCNLFKFLYLVFIFMMMCGLLMNCLIKEDKLLMVLFIGGLYGRENLVFGEFNV